MDTSLGLDLNTNPTHMIHEADQPNSLVDELNRAKSDNKKLTEILDIVWKSYHALQLEFRDLSRRKSEQSDDHSKSQKRKCCTSEYYRDIFENSGNSTDSSCSEASPKASRETTVKNNAIVVHVRADPSDKSLVVVDGYKWLKYGQKVTRDNPSPRAYYKCSFSPTCPAKKKVQRSMEDPCILVVAYEGKHNHQQPSKAVQLSSINGLAAAASTTKTSDFQQFLVEQTVSSLTRDSNFTAALAAAISERMLEQDLTLR